MSRKGLVLALSSAFLSSVCSLGVKKSEAPIGEIVFFTSCVILAISIPLLWFSENSAFPKNALGALWGQSLATIPFFLTSFQATRMMPLADEALLEYTSIAFTVIFARIFLSEPCSVDKIASICAILLGTGLITFRPPEGHYPYYIIGCILSLVGALFDTVSYIFIKKLTHLHFPVIIFHYSISSIFLSLPLCLIESWTINPSLYWLTILGAMESIFVTIALKTEQVGIVCLVHSSDIVFTYVWEMNFYDEEYTFLRVLGSLIISIAIIVTTLMNEPDGEDNLGKDSPSPLRLPLEKIV